MRTVLPHERQIFFSHWTRYLRWYADDDLPIRDNGAGTKHRAGADHAVFSNHALAQDNRLHPDQTPFAHLRPMHYRAVANGYVVADLERLAGIAMQDAMFLNIDPIADPNRRDIAAHDTLEPERAIDADHHIAAENRVGGLPVLVDPLHPCVRFIARHDASQLYYS